MAAMLVYLDKRILNIFFWKYTNMAANFFVVLIPRDWVKTLYSWRDIRDLKIAVYGKRLTSRNCFVIKSKSWTVKCLSYTIYYRNLKCCSQTPCMTTETLSLGHPSLDVRVDVRRLQWTAMSLSSRPIVKCKRQTAQVKRQAMWAENHLISTAKFL